MRDDGPAEATLRLLGSAATGGAGVPEDPLDPARAVRRALADARRKAFEVVALSISTEVAVDQIAAIAFARRSLGPHANEVRVGVAADDDVLDVLVAMLGPGELGITVSRADEATLAFCLEALSQEEAPDQTEESAGE